MAKSVETPDVVVTVTGATLTNLLRIKSLKAESRALADQAKGMESAFLAEVGLEKVDFERGVEFRNGNGKRVGSFKTSMRGAYEVMSGWVTKLTIQKAS